MQSGCGAAAEEQPTIELKHSPTLTASVPPTEAVEAPTSTPQPIILWMDPSLPDAIIDQAAVPGELILAQKRDEASLILEISGANPMSHWIYALVAPFPTIADGISAASLEDFWQKGSGGLFGDQPILLDEDTLGVLESLWGEAGDGAVQLMDSDQILEEAWNLRSAWAIIPFEDLQPRWKVLRIDDISPVQNDFIPASYALTIPVSLTGEETILAKYNDLYGNGQAAALIPAGNRDPGKLTVLAMTGVTAMVRATAHAMEKKGVTYPAGDIGGLLQQADITHVSNEVPFAENCGYPNPVQYDLFFCSKPEYIWLLEEIGTDVVELTGDHFGDYGPEAMLYTLDLYKQRGWPVYGGGANLEEGKRPLTLEHNGNKLAFIGCNAKGGSFATASAEAPGAVYCDTPYMQEEITRLRAEGYLPVATLQHFEYYTYAAVPPQQRDYRALAEAGAVIVSGSQAHHPQALEFSEEGLIHYGLGNLFFDQFDVSLGTRQAFIDRHVFYNGKYISTELVGILFIDYARPRLMTIEERQQLLAAVFSASGW